MPVAGATRNPAAQLRAADAKAQARAERRAAKQQQQQKHTTTQRRRRKSSDAHGARNNGAHGGGGDYDDNDDDDHGRHRRLSNAESDSSEDGGAARHRRASLAKDIASRKMHRPTLHLSPQTSAEEERMADMKLAFQRYDIDGNGVLDIFEIRRVFDDVGWKATDEIFERLSEAIAISDDDGLSFETMHAVSVAQRRCLSVRFL
jgi:hypothetical protein